MFVFYSVLLHNIHRNVHKKGKISIQLKSIWMRKKNNLLNSKIILHITFNDHRSPYLSWCMMYALFMFPLFGSQYKFGITEFALIFRYIVLFHMIPQSRFPAECLTTRWNHATM